MVREDRNIDFVEIEPFVEPVEPARKEKPVSETGRAGEKKDEKKPLRVKEFLDGSILVRETMTRQLPFILFLTVLAVLYIGNRYHAERMVRKISKTEVEVKDLRAEQITIAAELMNISKLLRNSKAKSLNLKKLR